MGSLVIELLLIAAVYGVPVAYRSADGSRPPRRSLFVAGCFDEMLGTHPPALLLAHRWEQVHGRFVRAGTGRDWGGGASHLELLMSSRSPEVVGPIAAGAVTWCSPGFQALDYEDTEDSHGPLRRVFSGHLQEVSLTQRPACRDHRALAWRFAA